MTTMENLNPQLDNEDVMRPYTVEELYARVNESMAEIEAGEVLTSEEANAEVRRELPWLR